MTRKKALDYLSKLKKLLPQSEQTAKAILELEESAKELPKESRCAPVGGDLPIPEPLSAGGPGMALYSDGACRGNPGPGSWGALGQNSKGEVLFEASGVEMHTTNNMMEMQGAIEALKQGYELLDSAPFSSHDPVYLISDSQYVVKGMNEWVAGWKRRGWKKADKKTPENVDRWKELDEVAQKFEKLKFLWVKGHSNHPQNERVDQLANEALDEAGL